MNKKRLRQCHLAIALVTGIFFMLSGLTGAALIYAKPIQRLINPHYWTVTPQSTPISINMLEKHIRQKFNQSPDFMTIEGPDNHLAWQVKLADDSYVSINPYTGKVLLQYDLEDTFYGFSIALHRYLMFPHGLSRDIARYFVSVVALLMLLEVLLGFYLWVKPKKPLKRFKINIRSKPKVFYTQLHSVVGVACFIPLTLIAFSGIAFHLKTPTSAVINWLTPGTIETRPPPPAVTPPVGSAPLQFDKSWRNASQALPGSTLFRIYFPTAQGKPLAFRVQTPGESHAYSWIWTDPYSGQILQVYDASQSSVATQVWNFKYKFHIGMFAGYLLTPLWLILSLSPLLFTLSGIYLWLKRRRQ